MAFHSFHFGSTAGQIGFESLLSFAQPGQSLDRFGKGDSATVWGVTQAGFNIAWLNGMGAEGYQGLTMWATAPGKPNALLTLAGYSQVDVDSGKLVVSFGQIDPSTPYLYVFGNS